ncbi:MAG TPA: PEP-utilizing enzyme [Mycobacterium sp.]|nr:PEP-utilizing enzyme [Mycobacterium sp.]
MRVLVSGARTDVTRCVINELTRRGHKVTDGPVDIVVQVATAGDHSDAIADVAPRLVVVSSAAAPRSGANEAPLQSNPVRRAALLIQAPSIMGRASTGVVRDRFAAPVILGVRGRPNLVQFLHHDDLARFTADAVEHPEWTGRVNLAADDSLALQDVAEILEKPYVEINPNIFTGIRRLPGVGHLAPPDGHLDTARLAELGFAPAWTGRDCVADFHRANRQHVFIAARRVVIPWRFPWTSAPTPHHEGPHRHPANDSGLGGEFDTTIDSKWPEFTCANVAEAFPGPMTPLSLELAMEAVRATGALAADIVGMTGELRRAVTEEHVGCFGHTVYVNLTVSRAASAMLPGADPKAWRDFLFGAKSGVDLAESGDLRLLGMVRRLPKIIALLSTAAREARRIEGEARDRQRDAAYYAARTDHELHSELRCVGDATVSSWAGAALGSAGVVPIMALIQRTAGKQFASQFSAGIENLASAGLIRGTYDLAERVRADQSIATILREIDTEQELHRLRADHPDFAARVDAVIAEYGHRGPSETELSSTVFVDTPARLIDVVAKLASSDPRPMAAMPPLNPALLLLAGLGAGFQRSREHVRDAAVRYTHNYRLIARELGARLAARGVIEQPGDVFYLVRDELTHPAVDIAARVSRRKLERTRLGQRRPPTYFTERWEPRRDADGELQPGEFLTGIPASAGTAKGPVRVLTVDAIDDLRPGEVLVAECTDTGWTPFFSYAAAVVVDTGAEMSHAAVIAREFGIPCVVGSVAASRVLRTGQVIEVDGCTGRITRLE